MVKNRQAVHRAPKKGLFHKLRPYLSLKYGEQLLYDPHLIAPTCIALFLIEIVANVVVIERVRYTEIDWRAYMQEVEGFLNGTWDYQYLKGDTGPLVYPAGFVYLYSALYYITSNGTNIYLAQYIFLILYLSQAALFYRILVKTAKIPPYALVLSTMTSYRIHSIFVLRLFNDPVAVLLFYISFNLILSNKWFLGSLFYSLAVSVKMNILLYAPCLLIAYLTNLSKVQTILNLALCGFVQLVLAVPFLWTNWYTYLKGSFDLGRIFEHKWTVNYRFLPREYFEHHYFHLGLLVLHILLLLLFTPRLIKYLSSYAKLNEVTGHLKKQIAGDKKKLKLHKKDDLQAEKDKLEDRMSKITQLFVLPFFVTNLIGVACARSLHYQFYSWYFHSLLYLVFCTGYRKQSMFLMLAVIEYCWNVYPSTKFSSTLLHVCHLCLIVGVYRTMRS